jgi:hypothetical protein
MLYFAYGSNMDWYRIIQNDRAPSAQFLLRATRPDHRLAFTRYSTKQKTGTADVLPAVGSLVWGALFDIDPADQGKLDAAEGVRNGAYRATMVSVLIDGDPNRAVRASTYVVSDKMTTHQPPASWYLNHIIRGAVRWDLPAAYVDALRKGPTT